jgi:hypothetical protein
MTLPSLRLDIADNLEALGYPGGAAALRWVETSGHDADDDTDERIEELEGLVSDYEDGFVSLRRLVAAQLDKARALTPAAFRDAVSDVLLEVDEH